ncbi:MAG: PIN domain-containing protein [Lachnospiraceae bacterium]|nr:PIN domain-containing protein [Lachnospiraceae bacterium]
MVNRVLIDTNILLDYLLTREPFYEVAKEVVRTCTEGDTKGCIATHSITNMFFILRKDYDAEERREMLINLCTIFDVEGIDKNKLLVGLQNDDFTDFEDCLQTECAKAYGAEYIVTRNVADYSASEITAILPKDFLERNHRQE